MRQLYKRSSAILLLLWVALIAVATVASVPTSVLLQNSELSGATNNDIASLNRLKLKNNPINKVKRSSDNGKSSSQDSTANNNGLEKKSSPEVVPESFNNAPSPSRSASYSQSTNKVSYSIPENPELINSAIAAGLTAAAAEAAAVAHQRDLDEAKMYEIEPTALMHKRGINAAQLQAYANDDGYYGNRFLNSAMLQSQVPRNGIWEDDIDPAASYNNLQEVDDYAPIQHASSYRNKAYDNLQNLLNAEAYLEPVALPYPNRYYSDIDADRSKRSNKYNRFAETRPKPESKITPADMLALVALVEAGERASKGDNDSPMEPLIYANDVHSSRNNFASNVGAYDYPIASFDDSINDQYNLGNAAKLYEPTSMVDYYGSPINIETMPKYEFAAPRDHKLGGRNRLSVKRFMVAKKSRPMGKFLNEPVAKPSISYNLNDENYF